MKKANNLSEEAQKGNPEAIAALLSDRLLTEKENIIVKASINNHFLEIFLEAEEVPERHEIVEIIRQELTELEPESIQRVKVNAKKIDKENLVWTQEFGLEIGAFSSLILSGSQEAEKLQIPSVTKADTEEKSANQALNNQQLSQITLWFVITILAVAVIIFIGKMIMERSPSEDNKNPTAYARIIPN